MKSFILLALLMTPCIVSAQYSTECFLTSECANEESLPFSFNINRDTTFILDIPTNIQSLSISGTAELNDWNGGHVRVTLLNDYNYEFLVYELYPLMADSLTSTLSHTAMETCVLDNFSPRKLKICISDARLLIDSLHYSGIGTLRKSYASNFEMCHRAQQDYIIDKLNKHLKSRQIPWRAGRTPLSYLTYEEKKGRFGTPVPNLGGYEYYTSGVFVMPDFNSSTRTVASNSPYVANFDWRNRHGKNWMTPAKDQGWCQSCWIFSAVGNLEAYVNLYYNRLLNYDLSEQEIMHCIANDNPNDYYGLGNNYTPCDPGFIRNAFTYVYNHGLVTENCLPYYIRQEGSPLLGSCSDKCNTPMEVISISRNATLSYTINEDTLKKRLLHSPISVSLYKAPSYGHSVVLCGYRTLQEGDSIYANYQEFQHITPNSPYIGQTVWICKDSSGENFGDNGYINIITPVMNIRRYNYLNCEIQSLVYTNDSIKVTDDDGDGYFFWGIGPRPTHCPSWAPNEPDGDDSDCLKGPMDEYGRLSDLNPDNYDTLFIETDTLWNNYRFQHRHVCIKNGAILTVCGTAKFHPKTSMTICSNAELNVNGGIMENVEIKALSGSRVKIQNNGQINSACNKNFNIPLGGTLDFSSGNIN